MTTVYLSKPVMAHGTERTEIELREPNAGDIAACGYPFVFINNDGAGMQTAPNTAVISAYVSRLAQIPPSSVAQMNAVDWNACMGVVLGFFGQSEPETTSSTDSSTSASSGNGSLERSLR